jgi:CheY-like chemotaxis protein
LIRNNLPGAVFASIGSVRYQTFPVIAKHGRRDMRPKTGMRPVVLVVEDEFLLRMDAIEVIEDAGVEVVGAKNADEAISILEQRDDIVLIFTDIDMPGSMDGLKLSHFVKDRWPPIRIIATSGHAKITANDLPEGVRFMPKPYKATELADAVHQLIQAP